MSALAALRLAHQHGLHVDIDGVDLVLDAEQEPPAEVLEAIRRDKTEIVAYLLDRRDSPGVEDRQAEFDERAAITEFDAGVPREWAEGFAALQIARPPLGITKSRWQQIIDDAGRFIDEWAEKAVQLGWTTVDVFGVHPTAPEHRYECKGLVPLLRGRPIIAITADTATIKAAPSATQRYFRKAHADGVPIWGLTECG